MTDLLLFLHILLFVFSFAFTAGISILLGRVAGKADPAIIHAAFRAARPLSMAGGIGWVLTALVGAALAGAFQLPMNAPWLLGSYVAAAILILTGFLVHSPWQARVIAASASPGPQPTPQLEALLRSPAHRIASGVSAACVLAIVYLMVARPG
ncbi:MAG TPA: DUF2269 family protein [Rhizomicrobium sp.]|nr:DUF2269 family protein [Rhizomicrobium sp.]